jgi:hypothetical protein
MKEFIIATVVIVDGQKMNCFWVYRKTDFYPYVTNDNAWKNLELAKNGLINKNYTTYETI